LPGPDAEELSMFTRQVIMKLTDGSAVELARIMESEVIPLLHAQKGFRHQDTSITSQLSEAVSNSYWDTQGHAEAYNLTAYPEMLKALGETLDGAPQVETFVISSSTFHRLTANRRAAYTASHLTGS
jgi:hypothetical protein